MNPIKLTKAESSIERELERGEWRSMGPEEVKRVADLFARARKDTVISLRLNSKDLAAFKKKAKAAGIPYQTLIAEIIHFHAVH